MKRKFLIGALCAAMCVSFAGCTLPGENADDPDDFTPDYSLDDVSQVEKVVNYEWLIEPMFTFDNVIVPDASLFYKDSLASIAYVDSSIYSENGKYGFIDYKGNTIVFPDYDDYYILDNGYMLLSKGTGDQMEFCSLNSDMQRVDYTDRSYYEGLVDNRIFYWDEDRGQRFVALEDGTCELFEEDTTVVVRRAEVEETGYGGYRPDNIQNGEYALADMNGLVTEFEFTNYYAPRYKDGGDTAFAMEKDGLWGYLDYVGNVLIDFICSPMPSAYSTMSADNTETMHPYLFSNGFVPVLINGGFGYYTISGDVYAAPGEFQQARPVQNGRAWVCVNGMWGVIKVGDIVERELSKPDLSSASDSSSDSSSTWSATTTTTTQAEWTPTTAEPEEQPAATTTTTQPVQTEPAQTEPAQTEPAQTEPAQTEPAETEPAQTEPAQTEPIYTEPEVTQPPETEPPAPVEPETPPVEEGGE